MYFLKLSGRTPSSQKLRHYPLKTINSIKKFRDGSAKLAFGCFRLTIRSITTQSSCRNQWVISTFLQSMIVTVERLVIVELVIILNGNQYFVQTFILTLVGFRRIFWTTENGFFNIKNKKTHKQTQTWIFQWMASYQPTITCLSTDKYCLF